MGWLFAGGRQTLISPGPDRRAGEGAMKGLEAWALEGAGTVGLRDRGRPTPQPPRESWRVCDCMLGPLIGWSPATGRTPSAATQSQASVVPADHNPVSILIGYWALPASRRGTGLPPSRCGIAD